MYHNTYNSMGYIPSCDDHKLPYEQRIITYYTKYPRPDPIASSKISIGSMDENFPWKQILLDIAPSVVAVSGFIDLQRKVDCSGLVVGWDEEEHEALVLTTAKVFRVPENYVANHKVFVRFGSSQLVPARLSSIDFHYNLAVLKVSCMERIKVAKLTPKPELCGKMEVVAVARSFLTNRLLRDVGSLLSVYPYFGCEGLMCSSCDTRMVVEGGPFLDYSGQVIGISFYCDDVACLLPAHLILERLFRSSPLGFCSDSTLHPWFGLTVTNASQLDVDALEKLALRADEKCVIVKEVFDGSPARELGVLPGDRVVSVDGYHLQTADEYFGLMWRASLNFSQQDAPRVKSPFPLLIETRDSRSITMLGEFLPVSDRKFCCYWPLGKRSWDKEPLFGSQTCSPSHEISHFRNLSLDEILAWAPSKPPYADA